MHYIFTSQLPEFIIQNSRFTKPRAKVERRLSEGWAKDKSLYRSHHLKKYFVVLNYFIIFALNNLALEFDFKSYEGVPFL